MGSTVLLLIIFIALYGYYSVNAKSKISAAEAVETVLSQYEGEVLQTKLTGDLYEVQLQTVQGRYEVKVHNNGDGIYSINALDALSGDKDGLTEQTPEVSQSPKPTSSPTAVPEETASPKPTQSPVVTSTKEPTETASPSDKPTPSANTTPKPSSMTLISEKKAIELALGKVKGTVEDVDLEQSGNKRYYLVEIETAEGREAEVQINAASGKIMSVTWSEDDDNDDAEDD